MEQDLIEKCNKYIEKGKVDKFYDYILENNLKDNFLKQTFLSTFHNAGNSKEEQQKALNVSNFALKISMNDLTKKYGEKLTNRFAQIMCDTPYIGVRNTSLYTLMNANINSLSEEEADKLDNILNFANSKDNILGTHITGKENGYDISEEGVVLTGHKFVANDLSDIKKNIRTTLDKNVTFFEGDPIGLAMQLINSRGYNLPQGEFNDIMIVSIPKKSLEQDEEGIIIQNDEDDNILNPIYIKGFARVNVESGKIEDFHDNPKYYEKQQTLYEKRIEDLSMEEWKEKFEQWYENSKTTKMQKLKANAVNFFKRMINKDKTKQIDNEQDR